MIKLVLRMKHNANEGVINTDNSDVNAHDGDNNVCAVTVELLN